VPPTAEEPALRGRLDVVRNARTAWYEPADPVLAGPYDTLLIEGWCAEDPQTELAVHVDGVARGRLVRGTPRPDLVPVFGPAGADAGYRGALALAAVAPGRHTLAVVATLPGGEPAVLGEVGLLVAAPQAPGPRTPHAALDVPPSGELAYRLGELLRPSGWAADTARGSAVLAAALVIDDRWVVQARTGLTRPDVAAQLGLGTAALGFEGVVAGELLGPGTHDVRALAFTTEDERLDGEAALRIAIVDAP
jgi:hypothetical protein